MEKVRKAPRQLRTVITVHDPTVQEVLRCVLGLGAGFLLSGARIVGVWVPAAAALLAALGSSLPAVAVWLGAAAGSLLLWDTDALLLNLSVGLLILAAQWCLKDTKLSQKNCFDEVVTALAILIVGLLFLAGDGISLRAVAVCLLRLILLPLGVPAARRVLARERGIPLCVAVFALISGSGGILLPGGVSVGGILAAAAAFSLCGTVTAPIMAALGGLALDWCIPHPGSAVTVLAAAALAGCLPLPKRWQKCVCFCTAAGLTVILSGGENSALFLAAVIGAGLALLLPPVPEDKSAVPLRDAARSRLQVAASAMEEICRELEKSPEKPGQEEISELYDRTAAQVCSPCAKYRTCWRDNAAATCAYLRDAAPCFLERGVALEEDFAPAFAENCRHFPDFLRVINERLDAAAAVAQKHRYRRELTEVLQGHYRVLADYLRLSVLPPRALPPLRFTAEVACRHLARDTACGDRTAGFRQGNHYYFLLCDGMGTGVEAAADSRRVIALLSRLLQSGMEPVSALEMLSGVLLLRDGGGTAALDLAAVDLTDGTAVLYKWGGAASYLKTGESVIKLGTASLPPGIRVGGTQDAQQIRLSLGGGEVLILTSDGIRGEDAERLLRQTTRVEARELAAGLVAAGSETAEDDRTAAVLCLRSPASC